jgi:SAM-dependent methyltransferase
MIHLSENDNRVRSEKDRYWEVWDKKHVHDLEAIHWGTAGTPKARGRHQALNQMVADLIPVGMSILEVAPGQGHLYAILEHDGKLSEYHGRDTSPDMRARFKELFPSADILAGDAYDLSPDPMADCVVAVDLLMHLPADLTTPMRQMWSRVNPNGVLIVTMRHPESGKESWIVERNYISDIHTDDQGKKLVVRGMSKHEFNDIIAGFEPKASSVTEVIYDERTSVWVVLK